MRRLLSAMALMLASSAFGVERPPPIPLSNIGPWVVEAEENLCLLTHGFGTAEAKVTLGFQPLFTSEKMEVLILAPDRNTDQRTGEATITLQPGDHRLKASYVSLPTRDRQRRLTRLTVDSEVMADLATATTLSVEGDRLSLAFQLAPTAKALQATDSCQRNLLTDWGVDPNLVDKAHAPVPHDPARAFGPDAYPYDAFRAGIIGRVVAVLQVDANGVVSNCRVVASAGDALNAGTCAAARSITFAPAHDDAGKAVPSIYVLPVRWVLPG